MFEWWFVSPETQNRHILSSVLFLKVFSRLTRLSGYYSYMNKLGLAKVVAKVNELRQAKRLIG